MLEVGSVNAEENSGDRKKDRIPPRFEMESMDKIEMEKIANFREKLCKISKK